MPSQAFENYACISYITYWRFLSDTSNVYTKPLIPIDSRQFKIEKLTNCKSGTYARNKIQLRCIAFLMVTMCSKVRIMNVTTYIWFWNSLWIDMIKILVTRFLSFRKKNADYISSAIFLVKERWTSFKKKWIKKRWTVVLITNWPSDHNRVGLKRL